MVFKPTDKTGTLAMMPFEGYDKSMREILAETYVTEEGEVKPKYPPSSAANLKSELQKIKAVLKEGCDKGFFGEKDCAAATPERASPGKLYGLPKDHKTVRPKTGLPPIRPVVSCCGGNLEGLGKLVDHFLRPVDEAAASFVQDTPDLLRKILHLNTLGRGSTAPWHKVVLSGLCGNVSLYTHLQSSSLGERPLSGRGHAAEPG